MVHKKLIRAVALFITYMWGFLSQPAKYKFLHMQRLSLFSILVVLFVIPSLAPIGIILNTPVDQDMITDVDGVVELNAVTPYGYSPTSGAIRRRNTPTLIEDLPREGIVIYTVQSDDTIFSIAERFGISPESIVWSNPESIRNTPWLIQPGLPLYIPPSNGVYHIVRDGETISTIAATYGVSVENIHVSDIREGDAIMVFDGVGEPVAWEPVTPQGTTTITTLSTVMASTCNVDLSGVKSNGFFILPTGSTDVSGWYFRDIRKPSHIGLDYRCRLGDPIYASDSGVVEFSGWSGGYGNLVRVNHANGYTTYYAHLDTIWATCGQTVSQGQIIGSCGTTGWSTGPHLHYEIRLNGVPQDPLLFE